MIKDEIDGDDVYCFIEFCETIQKPSRSVLLFAEFFMIDEWIKTSKCYFNVMPYHYAFIYAPQTVPVRNLSNSSRNVAQYVLAVRALESHSVDFDPQFDALFTDIDCPSMIDTAVISNVG